VFETTPADAKPMPKITVGDLIDTVTQLEALVKVYGDRAVLLDNERDAWQYSDEYDGWCCTFGDISGYSVSTMLNYGPFTVIWLPEVKS
jgi:hypothetical protein